jgi:hypothetical protein
MRRNFFIDRSHCKCIFWMLYVFGVTFFFVYTFAGPYQIETNRTSTSTPWPPQDTDPGNHLDGWLKRWDAIQQQFEFPDLCGKNCSTKIFLPKLLRPRILANYT